MSEKILVVDDSNNLKLKRKQIQDIDGYQAPTDAQTQAAVDAWMSEHSASYIVPDNSLTQAKLVKGTLGYVTPEMFGAVGDGVTNDYQAFADCAVYANQNKLGIKVPQKTYFINGSATIELLCNVECDNSVFIVGDNHFKTARPVFRYAHDLETQETNILLSGVFADNDTVTSAFADKFFLLDTKIAYGTPNSQTAPSNETVKEMIFTNGTKTHVWFDDVADHLNDTVDATHISDMGEIGYRFSGAVIRQKTENSYGITFLKIERNNMTVENIQMECKNELAENNIIGAEFCNAITFRNIKSYTIQPNIWGYEIGLYRVANVLVDNFKGYNEWSSIATNTIKNYTLRNSITNTFDCHWNAFGSFVCDGCTLYSSAHIGFGKGDYIVKDTYANAVNLRTDFPQPWAGRMIIENVQTNVGCNMEIRDSYSATGYDSYFSSLKLPDVHLKNFRSFGREMYVVIDNTIASRVQDRTSRMTIENCVLHDIDTPYTNRKYNIVLHDCFYTSEKDYLNWIGYIVYDNAKDDRGVVTPVTDYFTSQTAGKAIKCGKIVCLTFSWLNSATIPNWTTFATVSAGFRPVSTVYGVMTDGSSAVIPIQVTTAGNIQTNAAVSVTGVRLNCNIAYVELDTF